VTTAGTVGTWWFDPSACGCCASAVTNSFIRTLTTSFGSICFGSLIVAIIQALRMLADQAQANGDGDVFACIAQCILACLQGLVEVRSCLCWDLMTIHSSLILILCVPIERSLVLQ
jgi:Plasma-membrane choline transporter